MVLGTPEQFRERFIMQITAGEHKDSDAREVSQMKRRSYVLHDLLEGLVQVCSRHSSLSLSQLKYLYSYVHGVSRSQ